MASGVPRWRHDGVAIVNSENLPFVSCQNRSGHSGITALRHRMHTWGRAPQTGSRPAAVSGHHAAPLERAPAENEQ